MTDQKRIVLKGEEIWRLIKEQDLKLYWLSQFSGIDRCTFRRWRKGTVPKMSVEKAQVLAGLLSVQLEQITAS